MKSIDLKNTLKNKVLFITISISRKFPKPIQTSDTKRKTAQFETNIALVRTSRNLQAFAPFREYYFGKYALKRPRSTVLFVGEVNQLVIRTRHIIFEVLYSSPGREVCMGESD